VDKIVEVIDRDNEGQAAGVYRAGFTLRSLARVGVRGEMSGPGIKISSDKELTEVGRMTGGE
jgi:hypothetical protein